MSKPNKPNISKDFTIDDIHKIREYDYEVRENMDENEYKIYAKQKSDRVLAEIEKKRKSKNKASA